MRPASLATTLLLALTALVGPGLVAQPASAVAGRCDPGRGVSVVVDYGPLSSRTDFFCAPDGGGQEVAEIMRRAGVAFEYTAGQPFVCRIQGLPGADRESCTNTPPPDAYWGLFTSDGSTGWRYATQGAASQNVPDGGSVGWRFQDGGDRETPGAAPTARSAPKPQQKPSRAEAEGSGGGGSAGATGSASPTPQARSSATASASASASAGADRDRRATAGAKATAEEKAAEDKDRKRERGEDSADRDRATPEDPSVTDSAAEPVEQVQPLSAAGEDGGSAGGLLPLLVGGLVAAGLGSYAAIVAWRRRV